MLQRRAFDGHGGTWIIRMSPQPELLTQEVLAGLVEQVTYHNAENGFCVLRARPIPTLRYRRRVPLERVRKAISPVPHHRRV